MPAYQIEIEHRRTDQVFSYYHGEPGSASSLGMLHFNATLLARLHKQMPKEFRRITMDIGQAEYDLCMNNRGIEEPKVERLRAKDLREPGYGVLFDPDPARGEGHGLFTIVDGHHRVVRRYRGGARTMDFWITHPSVWKECLIEYDPEVEKKLAGAMPPKVDNPEITKTHAKVHAP
jgi:hypothetical protein